MFFSSLCFCESSIRDWTSDEALNIGSIQNPLCSVTREYAPNKWKVIPLNPLWPEWTRMQTNSREIDICSVFYSTSFDPDGLHTPPVVPLLTQTFITLFYRSSFFLSPCRKVIFGLPPYFDPTRIDFFFKSKRFISVAAALTNPWKTPRTLTPDISMYQFPQTGKFGLLF